MINLSTNAMKWRVSSNDTSYPNSFAVAVNNLEKNIQENWLYPSHL